MCGYFAMVYWRRSSAKWPLPCLCDRVKQLDSAILKSPETKMALCCFGFLFFN